MLGTVLTPHFTTGTRTRSTCSRAAWPCSSTTRRSCSILARSSPRRRRSCTASGATSRSVFLNFHTPDGGFADNLRARNRGEEGGFDSDEAEPGSGEPPTEAVFLRPGEGERLKGNNRVATIKVGREELSLIEFELERGFEGPGPAHP